MTVEPREKVLWSKSSPPAAINVANARQSGAVGVPTVSTVLAIKEVFPLVEKLTVFAPQTPANCRLHQPTGENPSEKLKCVVVRENLEYGKLRVDP